MGALLKNMNLARTIILLAVLGSAFLGYSNFKGRAKLEHLETSLATTVPRTVANIQILSQQYSKLISVRDKEGLSRNDSPESYIRGKADEKGAELGLVDITPSSSEFGKGVEDEKYRVKPLDKNAEYTRDQIAYFMWKLEEGSRRLKITDIDLQLAKRKGLKNRDIPEDLWTFSIQTTTRQEEAGN